MTENACKNCKKILKGRECPLCKSKNVSPHWKGIIVVLNPDKSELAKELKITFTGKYALKVR